VSAVGKGDMCRPGSCTPPSSSPPPHRENILAALIQHRCHPGHYQWLAPDVSISLCVCLCLWFSQEEAENERMHLLTFLDLKKPGPFFKVAVLVTQMSVMS
jgi:hypothetical protein